MPLDAPRRSTQPVTEGFSIIIPTYNRAKLLAGTFDTLTGLKVPKEMEVEILVIDNNCTDGTDLLVKEYALKMPFVVRHIVEPSQGLNYCRNRGMYEARYNHLVFFDDDVLVSPDWLHGYLEAVAGLGADCVVGPVEPWFECEVPKHITPKVLESVTSAYSRKGNQMMMLGPDTAHEIPGSNFGVLRQVALDVEGFDPALDRSGSGMLAGGDWDFGQRLAKGSKRVGYHPKCSIRHFVSSHKMSKRNLRARWYGLGLTQRHVSHGQRHPDSLRTRINTAQRLLKYMMKMALQLCAGNGAAAFELELFARREWGQARG